MLQNQFYCNGSFFWSDYPSNEHNQRRQYPMAHRGIFFFTIMGCSLYVPSSPSLYLAKEFYAYYLPTFVYIYKINSCVSIHCIARTVSDSSSTNVICWPVATKLATCKNLWAILIWHSIIYRLDASRRFYLQISRGPLLCATWKRIVHLRAKGLWSESLHWTLVCLWSQWR